MEITKEIAERIINAKALIEQALVPYKGIEINHIGYTDEDGEPWLWNDENGEPTDRAYAIVSFKAMTPYQLEQSVEAFIAEDYEEATKRSISLRVDVEKAREMCKGALGTLICHEVMVGEEGEQELALMAKTFAPMEAIVAKKTSLADLLAKRKAPVQQPEVKIEA